MNPDGPSTSRPGLITAAWSALALGWRASPSSAALRVSLTLVIAGFPPLVAWFGKLLVDELALGANGALARVTMFAVLGAAIGAAGLLISHALDYVTSRHDAAISLRAERDLFGRVSEFVGLRYFEDPRFQDRLLLAEQSASDGPSALTNFAQGSLRALVSLCSFVAVVATVWPAMAVLLVLAAIPGVVAETRLARRHVDASLTVSELERRRFLYRSLLTDTRAAKEVRLFGLAPFFRGRQLAALRTSQQVMVRLAGRTAVVQSALGLLGAVLAGVGVVVVARRVMLGQLTPGDVLLFMSAMAGVQGALAQIVAEIGRTSQSMKLFQRFLEVMRSSDDLPAGTGEAAALRRSLRFDDVWFRYDETGPWILRGVSFELPAGTSLGLVGLNGAGKSTLVKLVCRFYDPERGRILWDGTDIRELSPESLRGRIAATFQDFMTYDLPVGENIGVGDVGRIRDVEAIRRSARLAGIDEVIAEFPRGYDTMLSRMFLDEEDGEAGVTLSGGQWQRLAVARSLLRDRADLLILDEPSSGLDAEAEHRLHVMLGSLRRGRTSLLISHRLGSLRDADAIVVLADGVVVERGDHAELMRTGGVYARLFSTQARGYADTGATVS
ncbi:MAG TPA: ABC transporter ATP-binding protein [Pseudonocardiaceae bacterium]